MVVEHLLERIASESIDFVDLRVVDLAGRWRHVTVPSARFGEPLIAEGIAFDASNLGYGGVEGSDLVLRPDPTTGAVSEQDGDRVLTVICDIHRPMTGERFVDDPRAVAERAEGFLASEGIAASVRMSPEFEFYVFRDASFLSGTCESGYAVESLNETAERSFYHACPPEDRLFGLRNAVCRQLGNRGIDVKYHHHEVGAYGQVEIELGFLGLRDAADTTLIVKNAARAAAGEAGLVATFLPKPMHGESGSGFHVHQYLERDGASLFEEEGGLSELALCYIGGILAHGRSLCALTNPSTNSYRRLVPGFEAPVWFSFGEANRSAAVRIPGYASASERRMELRTPDATCNPYLAFAAMLMAGIDGIRNGRNAVELGYGPHNVNLYEGASETTARLEAAPVDLDQAMTCLEQDHEYLLAGGVFSTVLIENWIREKRREAREVRDRPHPHEYALYFDA